MKEHNLTNQIINYLDSHLSILMIDFLIDKQVHKCIIIFQIYPKNELLEAKYELLSNTNKVEELNKVAKEINKTAKNLGILFLC